MRMSSDESSLFYHLTYKHADEKKMTHNTRFSSSRTHILVLRGVFVFDVFASVKFTLIWHLRCSSCYDCRTWIKSFERLVCCGIIVSHPLIGYWRSIIVWYIFIVEDSTPKKNHSTSSCWSIARYSESSVFVIHLENLFLSSLNMLGVQIVWSFIPFFRHYMRK